LIISPYAKKGYIDSTLYDASSVLKFIEYNYNISSLGKRDADANNMLQAFDFTKAPREPLNLKTGFIKNLSLEVKKNIDKSKSVKIVTFIYLVTLPILAIIGFIIFWIVYRKEHKSRLVRR
jgi:phospholipase C